MWDPTGGVLKVRHSLAFMGLQQRLCREQNKELREPTRPSRPCIVIGFLEKWLCLACKADCWFINWGSHHLPFSVIGFTIAQTQISFFVLPFIPVLLQGVIYPGCLNSLAMIKVVCLTVNIVLWVSNAPHYVNYNYPANQLGVGGPYEKFDQWMVFHFDLGKDSEEVGTWKWKKLKGCLEVK